MKEKLKNLKVEMKFKKAFSTLLKAFIVAVVIALAAIAMINANVKRFYSESYKNMELQLEVRRDIQIVSKYVLWSITDVDGSYQEKIDEAVNYETRVEENVKLLEENFHDAEIVATLEEDLQALKAERVKVTDMVAKGNGSEAFALYNGSYTEAVENMQNKLIEVGESADAQAATAYGRIENLVPIIYITMILVGIISAILCMRMSKALTEIMLEPIKELQKVAGKLKEGDLDIEITYTGHDELGDLAVEFREACQTMRTIIEDMGYLLKEMASGNFNIHTHAEENYVGNFEVLISSIRKMNRDLNGTLEQMNQTSEQVMAGSGQLADSAQSLAEGATEQAGAVQELMATVEKVTGIAEDSAKGSVNAAIAAKNSAENAQRSREEINALTEAMERINVTSREIENIIAAIEEIASQTNLLSLNASIEAARAGEAGRGFAVVADQIGKLATDSAQSAVTTRELIGKSLQEIENGSRIVDQTMETIGTVLESMEQFANIASEAAESSKEQAAMLKQIETGIEQISSVVESNSASAEETSAISEELSAQAQSLEQMVSAFELRNK